MSKKVLKIVSIVLASIFAFVFVLWSVFNLLKFAIYSEYYSVKTNVCINPGLNDGFICQGVAYVDNSNVILVSGYMKDDSASRIYVTNTDSDSYFVKIKFDGEDFTGHAGGVATSRDNIYIANGKKIYIINLNDVLFAKNGDYVEVKDVVKVNNSASFVYTDDNYLYVGEFHDGGKYTIVGHVTETDEGMHYAYCTKYDLNDLTTPLKIYSIRDKVQGICFAPDGKVVMSTSCGMTDTVYYVYNESDATDTGIIVDGAPLYCLDKLIKHIKGPAMGEDLDYYNGEFLTLTESASNKYIFGKFFFANKIISLKI